MERKARDQGELDARRERGVLLGSGFVGGEGLLGVGIAAPAFITAQKPAGIGTGWLGTDAMAMTVGLIAFALFIGWFFRRVRG